MEQTKAKPWFNGPYVGRGLCMPIAWQGWAVLIAFFAASIACALLLRGEKASLIQIALLLATLVLIHAKRAN